MSYPRILDDDKEFPKETKEKRTVTPDRRNKRKNRETCDRIKI
jgi:hypothetical protein